MKDDVLKLDETDRRIVADVQSGLPLDPRPYDVVASRLGLAPDDVITRVQRMVDQGIIRRIGVVPNHYALGLAANGMSVWDVPDDLISQIGRQVGALDFVSHCYHRPRSLPHWPYSLFAMVHGKDRDEVERKVTEIAGLLGTADRGHQVLYSTRILKKTGLRIGA